MKEKSCSNCRKREVCRFYSLLEYADSNMVEAIEGVVEDRNELTEEDYESIYDRLSELLGKYCRYFEEE